MITVNGEHMEWEEGLTVQRLLEQKKYNFRMIAVWVNDEVVLKRLYSEAKIPDGAVVQVIHNISGG